MLHCTVLKIMGLFLVQVIEILNLAIYDYNCISDSCFYFFMTNFKKRDAHLSVKKNWKSIYKYKEKCPIWKISLLKCQFIFLNNPEKWTRMSILIQIR